MTKQYVQKITDYGNDTPKVFVIHENEEWLIPLREAFEKLSVPFEEWFKMRGLFPYMRLHPRAFSITE